MRLKCLFTGHRWHRMPWLKERQQPGQYWQMPGPEKACLECGKLKYRYVMFVASPFVGLGPKFEYEGQWLRAHDSYEDYMASYKRGMDELLRRAR